MSVKSVANESFSGQRLQLAREFRGLTQTELGKRVSASCALLSLCEAGKKKNPAPDLIDACGSVLGFEPAFFYRPLDDIFHENECNFRHRRTTPNSLKTRIRAHATMMGMVIDRLRRLFRFPALDVPRIPASSAEEIEAAAEQCRRHWKLGIDAPISQIGRVLEHAGVVVVPHLVESTKVDAFSRFGRTTIIFLNQAIPSTSRWNFDIAHECGHLVMHEGIVTGSIETEAAADRFASALLMPRRAFSREFRTKSFAWTHVFDLKRRWNASAAAIIRRAYDLGLIGAVGYRQSYKYMSFKGWTRSEPSEPSFQQPELLATALDGLGKKVPQTLDELRRELQFTSQTFQDVTGLAVPPQKPARVDVIPFSTLR